MINVTRKNIYIARGGCRINGRIRINVSSIHANQSMEPHVDNICHVMTKMANILKLQMDLGQSS